MGLKKYIIALVLLMISSLTFAGGPPRPKFHLTESDATQYADELAAAITAGAYNDDSVQADDIDYGDGLSKSGNSLVLDLTDSHTWTGTQTLPNQTYTILTSVPGSPVTNVMYCFDNDTADPCNVSGTDDYCARYDGSDWVAMFKLNGVKFFNSMPVPTLLASELDDTSDPHLLIEEELKGTILTNSESTGADEWDFPARGEGWNFIFVKEADQNIALDPNGSENWYFRTTTAAYTANGAGTSIVNTTAGKSTIACFSTETSVFCTGDANWEQGS